MINRVTVVIAAVAFVIFAFLMTEKKHHQKRSHRKFPKSGHDVNWVSDGTKRSSGNGGNQWAPSQVDSSMIQGGEWDTNRNPTTFVTNVSNFFPENDGGLSLASTFFA